MTRSRARSSSAIDRGFSSMVLRSLAKNGMYDIKPIKSINPANTRKSSVITFISKKNLLKLVLVVSLKKNERRKEILLKH